MAERVVEPAPRSVPPDGPHPEPGARPGGRPGAARDAEGASSDPEGRTSGRGRASSETERRTWERRTPDPERPTPPPVAAAALRAVLTRNRPASIAQDGFVRWGVRAWSAVGIVVLGYLVLLFIGYVKVLLVPLLVAGIVVFLLNPIVARLHRVGLPRLLGTALAYLLVLGGVIGGAIWLAVPVLVEQVQAAVAALPTDLEGAEERVEALAERFGLDVEVDGTAVQAWIVENRDSLLGSLTGVGAATAGFFVVVGLSLVGLVAAFYLLVDLPRLRRVAVALIPPERRTEITGLGGELSGTVGGFLRGQIIVAAFVGISTTLAMYLLGLPLWLFVGIVAGVTNLVPFIGPFVGGLLAVTIALANGEPLLALWVLLAIVAIQQVESQVVAPLVVGRTVELHPVVVLLAILVGGSLAGILGLLVAVPLAASARVLFRHVWLARSSYGGDLYPGRDGRVGGATADVEAEAEAAGGAAGGGVPGVGAPTGSPQAEVAGGAGQETTGGAVAEEAEADRA